MLGNILSPLSFEADTFFHLKRFVEREWIIERINRWLEDVHGDKVFWISGGPGTGKTALASYLQYYHPAVKSFFLCKAPSTPNPQGRYEPGDPRWCVRTMAYHLAAMIPDYQNKLLVEKRNIERIVNELSAEDMFEKLITEGLYGIQLPESSNVQTAIVLIDGLDEVTRDNHNDLASFLVRNMPKTPDWLRVLVLCRNEDPLSADFQRYIPLELDQEGGQYDEDLRRFIRKEFVSFVKDGYLPDVIIDTIIRKSERNFLYVEKLREALEKNIIRIADIDRFPNGLGELFNQWLKRKFTSIEDYRKKYFNALSIICTVESPLAREEAEILFNWTRGYEFNDFKERFGALFKYDNDYIVPFHKSFAEWLSENRAGQFQVDLEHGHQLLVEIGYKTFMQQNAILNRAEQRCIQELPVHLLAFKKNPQVAHNRLYEFLTNPSIFATYYRENIHGYISHWNALSRAYPEKHLLLNHCATILEKKSNEMNSQDWKVYYAIGKLYFELCDRISAARMYKRAAKYLPRNRPKEHNALIFSALLFNEIAESYCHAEPGKRRNLKRAKRYYKDALNIRRQIHYEDHSDLAESINNMGHVYYYRGDYESAFRIITKHSKCIKGFLMAHAMVMRIVSTILHYVRKQAVQCKKLINVIRQPFKCWID